MKLTPIQCAEQFDAYATAAEQARVYSNLHGNPNDAPYHQGKSEGYSHAARFLREFASSVSVLTPSRTREVAL